MKGSDQKSSAKGFDASEFLRTLTQRPGVYRMLNDADQVLYVGKAKNLKRRVGSYFTRSNNARIQRMVSQVSNIDVTVTHTEAEALLLENILIKELRPRYNILLRDDKSYPYIYLSDDDFPRISFYRGPKQRNGRMFGPYLSARAVRETLHLLQRIFPIRQCENSYFNNRSRPCLQYQIKRCTGPCVGLVSTEDYARDVADTQLFLEGRAADVIDRIGKRMERAAADLQYEDAARFRDQISALRQVQEKQYVSGGRGDLDVVACAVAESRACVQVFRVRGGHNLGNRAYFPKTGDETDPKVIMAAFLAQHYLGRVAPAEILVSHMPGERLLLQQALSEQMGRAVRIIAQPRGDRARWLKMARENVQIALDARLAGNASARARTQALAETLGLSEPPGRMECFDISHTSGDQAVASCVVFNEEGPLQSEYRRYNIRGVAGGDDYGALRQALTRRYERLMKGEGVVPDVLFIDGGKGQLHVGEAVLEELAVAGVQLVSVAKGADRRVGLEQLFLPDQKTALVLPEHSPALHLVQQIRDEAHRFAITGHRQRRGKQKKRSTLEDIPGIGPKRRQRLLTAFGGLQGLSRAGVEDIATVQGVSRTLAQQIYANFHGDQ